MSDQATKVSVGDFPAQISAAMGVKGCVVIAVEDNCVTHLAAHGLNHFETNQALSLGIHMNLSQHDALVLAGAAGEPAQQIAQSLEQGGA